MPAASLLPPSMGDARRPGDEMALDTRSARRKRSWRRASAGGRSAGGGLYRRVVADAAKYRRAGSAEWTVGQGERAGRERHLRVRQAQDAGVEPGTCRAG